MSLQLNLFVATPRARRVDPETSHEAAHKAAAFAGTSRPPISRPMTWQ